MHRLPTKTKAPLRMDTSMALNSHADPKPVPRYQFTPVVASSDWTPPLKLLRLAAVKERTGLSRWTISRLERRGAFPRHHRISANAVAWVEEEILNWIRSKVAG